MGAVNPNALSKFVGILEVAPQDNPSALQRVASVRGLVSNFDNTVNAVDIKADDTGTVFKGFIPEVRFEGTFLENADRDLINLILGGTTSNVAGTPVAGATQVLSSGSWDVNIAYKIENQNGDGSALTINSVTGSVDGALTANDDYDIVKLSDGDYAIVLQDVASATNLTTIVQDITVDYDYTPNAREDLNFPISFTESPRLYVKITATDDDTSNTRTFILDDASFEGVYGLENLDIVEAGDLTGTTFVFKGNKGSNFTYQNEIL